MKSQPDYSRFPMLEKAWVDTMEMLDDQGEVRNGVAEATAKFMKRKCCDGLPSEACAGAFNSALEIRKATIHFRRTKCPTNGPKASKQYELLHSLATELETRFPESEQLFVFKACQLIEMWWVR